MLFSCLCPTCWWGANPGHTLLLSFVQPRPRQTQMLNCGVPYVMGLWDKVMASEKVQFCLYACEVLHFCDPGKGEPPYREEAESSVTRPPGDGSP